MNPGDFLLQAICTVLLGFIAITIIGAIGKGIADFIKSISRERRKKK